MHCVLLQDGEGMDSFEVGGVDDVFGFVGFEDWEIPDAILAASKAWNDTDDKSKK